MKKITQLAAVLAMFGLSACATQPIEAAAASTPETRDMLTIITSEDAETQLMALVLTRSAMAAGVMPRVLLCSGGGDLALMAPPASAVDPLKPQGASPQTVLRGLIDAGVQVDVCAIYLPNRPFGPEALLEGVGVARPDEIGRLIAAPDVRLFSF